MLKEILVLSAVCFLQIHISYQTSIARNEQFRSALFLRVYTNTKLSIATLVEYVLISLKECGRRCIWNDLCKAFNYHSGDKACHLLSSDRNNENVLSNFQSASNWSYYDTGIGGPSINLVIIFSFLILSTEKYVNWRHRKVISKNTVPYEREFPFQRHHWIAGVKKPTTTTKVRRR